MTQDRLPFIANTLGIIPPRYTVFHGVLGYSVPNLFPVLFPVSCLFYYVGELSLSRHKTPFLYVGKFLLKLLPLNLVLVPGVDIDDQGGRLEGRKKPSDTVFLLLESIKTPWGISRYGLKDFVLF
jgi:hypothetical protein